MKNTFVFCDPSPPTYLFLPTLNYIAHHIFYKLMKKNAFFTILILFFGLHSYTQVTKGYWLVGGNINYSSTNFKNYYSSQSQEINIKANTNVGYFILTQFSLGLKTRIGYFSTTQTGFGKSTQYDFNLGPFVRYYFLKNEHRCNFLAETFYQYGFNLYNNDAAISSVNSQKSTLGIQTGAEIYFNTSIAVELLIGYDKENYVDNKGSNSAVRFGIGLQAHLIKEK